jgi:hypothetical protein
MFVRWKKRPYTLKTDEKGFTYSAYLVESKRIEGKPRQINRGYLGSIRKGKVTYQRGDEEWKYGFSCQCSDESGDLARGAFYAQLRDRMKWLQLNDEQQLSIEQLIAKFVPHMTAEQYEAYRKAKRDANSRAYIQSLRK